MKELNVKAILFDFDGTLVNSAPGIVKTMEQTFVRMGIHIPSENEMRATIGLPLRQALQQLGNLSDKDADIAADTYRELFPIYEVNYVTVFENVEHTLRKLLSKGIRMAIVTSRDEMSLSLIKDKRGLSEYFETYVTGADGFTPKPAPDMVYALLERMNLQKEETLVVGDTTFDIDMGNAAECWTCGVTYGNHTKEQLMASNPNFLIDDLEKITNLIRL